MRKLLFNMLRRHADRVMQSRKPDQVIGYDDHPYLRRWTMLPKNWFFNVYYHEFLQSDDSRALHDHPFASISVIIEGHYVEYTHTSRDGSYTPFFNSRSFFEGAIITRLRPSMPHRIELVDGQPCRTVFVVGPRVRNWGFHCPGGWRHWKVFTSDGGKHIGIGCD